MQRKENHFHPKSLHGSIAVEENLEVEKEDFVRTMLHKIAAFIKKIFSVEPIPATVNTLRDALNDLEVARNHFENCDPEFVTAAIFELNAAESRLDAARRCVV